jgi:hypothetical protein
VCRFHIAASWRCTNKNRKRRPCWSVTKLASITFWSLAFSYWIDKPRFLIEGKTCYYAHHTFLLRFTTGWLFCPHQDLTTMWWDSRSPTNLHFLNQHQQLDNNCHQVSAEARSKKMKESTTTTNLAPRNNRISSIVLVELPPNTARIRRSLVHDVPPVLDMIVWRLPCVFLECALLPCACAYFWPLGLKNPLVCKTRLGNPTKMCFPSHLFMSTRRA